MKNESLFDGVKNRRKKYALSVFVLGILVCILTFINLTVGENVFLMFRLPRTIAAIFSGIAFGVAGNIFQTLLKNPLASPDIIGVSSGSTAAAVYCILYTARRLS